MGDSPATDLAPRVAIRAGDLQLGPDLTVPGVAGPVRDRFLAHLRRQRGAGG